MRIAAVVAALLAAVCYLVALLGGQMDVDLVTLGHVFVAACLAAMNLTPYVRR
jgi:hypothetical protein